jgi:CubicO group peptidase (beta-lactamase class C family)
VQPRQAEASDEPGGLGLVLVQEPRDREWHGGGPEQPLAPAHERQNFTAAAILRLETDRKLSVQDPLSKFLPHTPEDKRAVTIHQLLTHTSGVTEQEHGYAEIDKENAVHGILGMPPQFKPGSKWAYSNAGYVLLAAVIEAASGASFQDYMVQNVFRPAGLSSTGFWGARLPQLPPDLIAKGYDELGLVTDPARLSGDTWNDIGSGQMVSTIDDLYRWQQNLEQHRVLSETQLAKMLTPVMKEPASDSYYTSSYGYGMWAQTLADGTLRYHHGGDFLGFSSQLTWLPARKTVITAVCNVRNDLYPVHRRADRAIPDILAGARVPEPPSYVRLPVAELERFLGTYALPTGSELTVYRSPDGLAIGADGQDATQLLDGTDDQQAQLAADGHAAEMLFASLSRGDDSGLAAVGLGDPDARRDIHRELESVSSGLGSFKGARTMGTYVGGLLGRFHDSVVELRFERGVARYKVQWDGKQVVATDVRCAPLAASTLLQPKSARELVGWNIVTLKQFALRFDPAFQSMTLSAGAHGATAQRRP